MEAMEEQGYLLQEETSNPLIVSLGNSKLDGRREGKHLRKWKWQAREKGFKRATPSKVSGSTQKRKLLKEEEGKEGADKRRKNEKGMG